MTRRTHSAHGQGTSRKGSGTTITEPMQWRTPGASASSPVLLIFQANSNVEWGNLSPAVDSNEKIRKEAMHQRWHGPSPATASAIVLAIADDEPPTSSSPINRSKAESESEISSSSSGSETLSSASDSADDDLAANFRWALPKRGMMHVIRTDEDTPRIPMCRNIQLVDSCMIGHGISEATATGARWCPLCVAKSESPVRRLIGKTRL
jgi:hypothetical protein